MGHMFKRYCKDYENIENYEKAKADNFKGWDCHHRLETHTPDGKRRDVDIPQKELIALGMYYHRPSEELIFLTTREHNAFKKGKYAGENNPMYGKPAWNKGIPVPDEQKKRQREAMKGKLSGEKNPMYGKKHSEESKKKNAKAHKGRHPSEESRIKMSESHKGLRWFNNGKINKRAKKCPEGFVPGILR